jgi:hypothetical protein
MVDEETDRDDDAARRRLKRVAVRVVVVQIVTLVLLWILQSHFSVV